MVRIFDFLSSLSALIILSPLFIVLSIIIKLTSKGPIFYLDTRVGKNKINFKMLKFRSMKINLQNSDNWFTQENDPRITKIGSFLRKTSLDELPQLINVLKGDMSLVGPRPESPFSKDSYDEFYWEKVHNVKPGITGLAQINGRSNLKLQRKMEFDIEYVDKFNSFSNFKSLVYNIEILLKTVKIVLIKSGSN